jgi:hypothetical protein
LIYSVHYLWLHLNTRQIRSGREVLENINKKNFGLKKIVSLQQQEKLSFK